MAKLKKKWISNIIAIGFIIYLYFLLDVSLLISTIQDKGYELISVLFIFLLTQFFRLIRNYYVLKSSGSINISLLKFLPNGMVANTISTYGPFKSGELAVIQIYNSQFNVNIEDSTATIILGRTLDIVVVLLLALSGIFLFSQDQVKSLVTLVFLIALLVILIFIFLLNERFGRYFIGIIEKKSSRPIIHKIALYLDNYYLSLKSLLNNRNSKSFLVLFTILRWISELSSAWLLYHLLGVNLALYQLLPIIGFSYAVGVASGSPGSIGTAQITAYSILVFVLQVPKETTVVLLSLGLILGIIVNLIQITMGFILASLFPVKFKS